jgi:hypothetical protein
MAGGDGLPTPTGQIPIELRIGVSGHRYLRRDDDALSDAVAREIGLIRQRCTNADTNWTAVGLTVVSPLAEGADRIVAHAAIRAGARLEAILPLRPSDYRTDFHTSESAAEFEALLDQAANVTVIPPAGSRKAAYGRGGRAIVDRSDVMLVLWDTAEAHGAGGTAEIVAYARQRNVPLHVIRINPQTRTVADPAAANGGSAVPVRAEAGLGAVSAAPARPSRPTTPAATRAIDGASPDGYGPLHPDAFAKLDSYNRWLSRNPPRSDDLATFDPSLEGRFGQHIAPYWRAADHAALTFQSHFRLIGRLQYLLSAAAVVIVASQIVFDLNPRIVWGEFSTLVLLVAILVYARVKKPLEKWISSRYLAERLRSSLYLSMASIVDPLATAELAERDDDPSEEWLRRGLSEIWCHGPSSDQSSPDVLELRTRIAESWLVPQIAYHGALARRCHRNHRRFARLAVILFALSAAAALVHSAGLLEKTDLPRYVSLISVVVPAIGAAISGYAAQRDYARQAIRSDAMQKSLTLALGDLSEAADLGQLQRIVLRIDQRMLGDSAEWYTGTRLHELELA